MAKNIYFNSNSLQTDHILVREIEDAGIPNKNLSIYEQGHANASKVVYESYPSRTIRISGTVYGDSITDLDNRLDLFKYSLLGVEKNLDIDYNSTTRRYIATLNTLDVARPAGLAFATFSGEFTCSIPFGLNTVTTTTIAVTVQNLLTNPSFETDLSTWTASGATITRVTTDHQDGTASMQIVTTGGSNQGAKTATLSINAGGTYTFSCYVKVTAGVTVHISMDSFDSSGVYQRSFDVSAVGTGAWQRIQTTAALNITEARLQGFVFSTAATTFLADAAQLEQTSAATTYGTAAGRTGSSYTDNVTFMGTAPFQQPIITWTLISVTSGATGASVIVGNNSTGQQVTITRNWTAGDVLIVDSKNKTVTVNGTAVDFSGAFAEFPPGAGSLFNSHSMTGAVFTYNVTYYPMWL